jgi:hypothetical protein
MLTEETKTVNIFKDEAKTVLTDEAYKKLHHALFGSSKCKDPYRNKCYNSSSPLLEELVTHGFMDVDRNYHGEDGTNWYYVIERGFIYVLGAKYYNAHKKELEEEL